jgi:hypothetical protein
MAAGCGTPIPGPWVGLETCEPPPGGRGPGGRGPGGRGSGGRCSARRTRQCGPSPRAARVRGGINPSS